MTYQELLQQFYEAGGASPIQDGEYRLGQQMVTLPDGRSAMMDAAGNLVVYDPATPGAGSEGGGAMYRVYDVGGGVSAPQWQASGEPGRNVRRSLTGLAAMAAAPFIGYGVNQLIGAGASAGAGAGGLSIEGILGSNYGLSGETALSGFGSGVQYGAPTTLEGARNALLAAGASGAAGAAGGGGLSIENILDSNYGLSGDTPLSSYGAGVEYGAPTTLEGAQAALGAAPAAAATPPAAAPPAAAPPAAAPPAATGASAAGMSWPLAAALLGSGLAGAYTANRAAEAQERAAQQATDLQREMFERQISLNEPWRQAGVNALTRMQSGDIGLTQDPSYAFRFSEGLKALQRTRAAGGKMFSGGSERAATRYGQDLASTEYGNAWNRLAALAGIGQTATGAQAGAAGQYGTNAANLMTSGAAARASGYVGTANALTQALGQGINLYQQNRLMDLYGPRPYTEQT